MRHRSNWSPTSLAAAWGSAGRKTRHPHVQHLLCTRVAGDLPVRRREGAAPARGEDRLELDVLRSTAEDAVCVMMSLEALPPDFPKLTWT
jgi:hypothetical protein